ncbi:MAG: hypothetical protein ABSC60_05830 [Acidobacteriota bacterium]|jgi:hypothetical protein
MLDRTITPPPANESAEGGDRRHARNIEYVWKVFCILYSFGIGLFLLYLPWQSFWENNYLLYLYPQLRPVIANPFLKGFIQVLGIADIMIGIYEVAHFKDLSKKIFLSR